MRKIIFRGKRKDNGEWVYGWYVNKAEAKHQIVTKEDVMPISVHPETVGQFTGLTDKNGKEIYEGDVVQWERTRIDWSKTITTIERFEVEYRDIANYNQDEAQKLEIIGNIHDNPSLLTNKE